MIVLDTTVLAYAAGGPHPLGDHARRLLSAVARGEVHASTTPEVIQEFVHIYGRRRPRPRATAIGRRYALTLAPLLPVLAEHLEAGLGLFERTEGLGAFDAVLAATAAAHQADALVSADRNFEAQSLVRWLDLDSPDLMSEVATN